MENKWWFIVFIAVMALPTLSASSTEIRQSKTVPQAVLIIAANTSLQTMESKRAGKAPSEALMIEHGTVNDQQNTGRPDARADNGSSASDENERSPNSGPQMTENHYASPHNRDVPGSTGIFVIQVGAYKNIRYAKEMIEQLQNMDLRASIEKEGHFHKVRISGIQTIKEGNRLMREINFTLHLKPFMYRTD